MEVNQTKIKGGCQSRRKVVPRDSKSDLPLTSSSKDEGEMRNELIYVTLAHIYCYVILYEAFYVAI